MGWRPETELETGFRSTTLDSLKNGWELKGISRTLELSPKPIITRTSRNLALASADSREDEDSQILCESIGQFGGRAGRIYNSLYWNSDINQPRMTEGSTRILPFDTVVETRIRRTTASPNSAPIAPIRPPMRTNPAQT